MEPEENEEESYYCDAEEDMLLPEVIDVDSPCKYFGEVT